MGFLDKPVSQAQLDGDFARAYMASQKATVDCVTAFSETDFRDDLAQIHVPALIIHGDADKVVPIEASAERTAAALPNAQYIVYEGAPHGLVVSEKDRVIEDLLSFIQEGVSVREPIGTTTLY
jgi:pimeloyl-ACP methyl ester carboxylesterase